MSFQVLISLTFVDAVKLPWFYFILIQLNYSSVGSAFAAFPPAIMKVMGLK